MNGPWSTDNMVLLNDECRKGHCAIKTIADDDAEDDAGNRGAGNELDNHGGWW